MLFSWNATLPFRHQIKRRKKQRTSAREFQYRPMKKETHCLNVFISIKNLHIFKFMNFLERFSAPFACARAHTRWNLITSQWLEHLCPKNKYTNRLFWANWWNFSMLMMMTTTATDDGDIMTICIVISHPIGFSIFGVSFIVCMLSTTAFRARIRIWLACLTASGRHDRILSNNKNEKKKNIQTNKHLIPVRTTSLLCKFLYIFSGKLLKVLMLFYCSFESIFCINVYAQSIQWTL